MADDSKKKLVVLGAGPGGYVAAFYAADLGLDVTLIDLMVNPGGTCLYRGCIPSKALLHASKILDEAKEAQNFGIEFVAPSVNLDKIRENKNKIVSNLTEGLGRLTKARKINFLQGRGTFTGPNTLHVAQKNNTSVDVAFDYAIIATGSVPSEIPGIALKSSRVLNSTTALSLMRVPESLLVVGGGYIGLELGSVYASLGSQVSVVEMMDGLLPGADKDLSQTLQRQLKKKFVDFMFQARVVGMTEEAAGVRVLFEGEKITEKEKVYDAVLVSIGRKPNAVNLGLEQIGVQVTKGFIDVKPNLQTTVPHIFAVGDVIGQPMLAHKASHEARIAVDSILGKSVTFAPRAIPAVMFTDPEVAWCGVTETEAKQKGLNVKIEKFPWLASGRALTLGRTEGFTKLICDAETGVLLGAAMIGVNAGDMISECALAVENQLTFKNIAHTIHPHPTLSETIMEAAEMVGSACVHLAPKRRG